MAWLAQYSPILRDVGTLVFALVGAVFAGLAWGHRRLEIKEKFYNRRFDLYWSILMATSNGQTPGDLSWRATINRDQHQAGLLFGPGVEACVAEIREHLGNLGLVDNIKDTDDRVAAASAAMSKLDTAFQRFKVQTKPYLRVDR